MMIRFRARFKAGFRVRVRLRSVFCHPRPCQREDLEFRVGVSGYDNHGYG